ncbi:MAG: M15 family metallopeptidase [Candidatus Omnitrophota bacterium]
MTFFLFFCSLSFAEDNPLIDIQEVNPRVLIEVRYATSNNFMKEPLYAAPRCLLRREVAEKLSRVQERLEKRGLGLKLFDGYRPLSVQKKMWARFPVEGYVANPAKGSNHNRGAAVDLTLVNAGGHELPMPTPYDEFSERAHRDYAGGTEEERRNRVILQEEMEKEGFKGLSTEWWHFDDRDSKVYPLLDLPIEGSDPSAPRGQRGLTP